VLLILPVQPGCMVRLTPTRRFLRVVIELSRQFRPGKLQRGKDGSYSLTKTLAAEGAKYNIKSTVIAPVRSYQCRLSCSNLCVSIDGRVCHDGNHDASRNAGQTQCMSPIQPGPLILTGNGIISRNLLLPLLLFSAILMDLRLPASYSK